MNHHNEKSRLKALINLEILDSPQEDSFDQIIYLVRRVFSVPIAAITFLDKDRRWFKSSFGMNLKDAPREPSFCNEVIKKDTVIVIENTGSDPQFGKLRWVEHLGIKFYAGFPLRLKGGEVVGTISISDINPRTFSTDDFKVLEMFASQTLEVIKSRQATKAPPTPKGRADVSTKIIETIATCQEQFIATNNISISARIMLELVLEVTGSEYGFIGERLQTKGDVPYLKTHAISNIAWNEETKKLYDANQENGFSFYNLKTLFGAVLTTEETVIANTPSTDPRRGGLPPGHPPMNSFMGIPVIKNGEMVGMVGLANRKGGYDQEMIEYLSPILSTYGHLVIAKNIENARQAADAKLKQTAEELTRVNSELIRSNDELAQFAYIVSHDLQTPLRHISTYAEIIEENLSYQPNSEVQTALGVIRNSVTRLYEMIDALLHYTNSSNAALNFQNMDTNTILDQVLATLESEIKTTNTDLGHSNLLPIFGDNKTISLVFQNLIENAIKYRSPARAPKIYISSKSVNNGVEITVQDNGLGINPMYHGKIFKIFQRVPDSQKMAGSGIGLAICKKIIEQHGGKIWIESNLNEGSHFKFWLPSPNP